MVSFPSFEIHCYFFYGGGPGGCLVYSVSYPCAEDAYWLAFFCDFDVRLDWVTLGVQLPSGDEVRSVFSGADWDDFCFSLVEDCACNFAPGV